MFWKFSGYYSNCLSIHIGMDVRQKRIYDYVLLEKSMFKIENETVLDLVDPTS